MFKNLTLAALLAILVGTSVSTAFAEPRHPAKNVLINRQVVPETGAEAFQSRGIAEDNGQAYHRR